MYTWSLKAVRNNTLIIHSYYANNNGIKNFCFLNSYSLIVIIRSSYSENDKYQTYTEY